jgi:DNA-binding NarL/FixJ family response regulator
MSQTKHVTVLLVDDHAETRRCFHEILRADKSIRIVGEALNGREAVTQAASLKPDVILMDFSMPLLNGLEASKLILKADPSAKVVIVSAYTDKQYVEQASEAGTVGFLGKLSAAELLVDAVHEVAKGNLYFGIRTEKRSPPHGGPARSDPENCAGWVRQLVGKRRGRTSVRQPAAS